MNTRFKPEVDAINASIAVFNQFLHPSHIVPTFQFDTMLGDKHCIEVVHGNWNAFGFPSSERRGVYFIFGHEKTTPAKNGLYIGKASFGSSIGRRLYSHFHPYRSQSHFLMNGYHDERYVLDYMAAINLDACGLPFMASALEEYLIADVGRRSINLINGTGNYGAPVPDTALEPTPTAP